MFYIELFPQDCAKQHCGLSYSSHSMHVLSIISLIIIHLAIIPAGHLEAS